MSRFKKILQNKKVQFLVLILVLVGISASLIYAKQNQVLPQAAIYFLNDLPNPQKDQKIIVFSPHPDDESLGAGGYINRAVSNGATVKIVLVTNGNKHGLKDQRYQEFKNATHSLGVEETYLTFLDYPDGELALINQKELHDRLQAEISGFKPDIFVFPHVQDTHPDHSTTGKIILQILRENNMTGKGYQYLVHDRRFPQPKKYAPSSFLLPPMDMVNFDKEWQRLMLTKEEEDKKYKAIKCYKSQLKVPFLKSLMLSMIRQNEIFSITQ